MNETINNATKEVIQYNRIGGTPESPIYFNDPVPRSNTPLTQTAIPVSDLQGATPIKVPNITPPRSEVPAIVAQADQSVVNYQEAQRRADELLKTQGNTAQNERNALNKLAESIFGQKSDIIGSQAQREKDLGIVEQQKALQEVNSQIADTTIQLRAEQDRVRNTPMSQSQKAVELGVIEDTYGRRLTDMAIRQSAAQGNISAIREESDRQTRLLIAPLDNKLQYLTTFAKENVDALDRKEQQRLNLIIQDVQSQKEDVKALQTAKSSLITEIANNGGGTNTNLVAQIQGAKTIDEAYAIAGKSGYVGKLDRQIKQAQISKLNAEAQKAVNEAKVTNSPIVSENTDYFNALANASISLPENQRKENTARLNQLLKSGDKNGAKELIIRTAFAGQTGTQREDTIKRLNAIDSLNTVKGLLNEAVRISGDTGIVSGNLQNVKQKLGKSGNPELAKIDTRITQALQIYRNAITGAAWGEQETAEYKKIFPSLTNTNKLNTSTIDSMTDALNANQRVTLGSYIGQTTYDKLFNEPQVSTSTIVPSNISSGIKQAKTLYTPKQILDNLISNPEVGDKIRQAREAMYSDDQIINFLEFNK